jgi:hypothetical protein
LKSDEVSAELKRKQKELKDDMIKAPVKFGDVLGRKFTFPWHLCKTWKGMESLIKQAFVHADVIGARVHEGHYDLMGPTGEIVLPQVWDMMVEPGWEVFMHMWPVAETPKKKKKKKEKRVEKPVDPFDAYMAQQFAQMGAGQVDNVPLKKAKKDKDCKKAKRISVSPPPALVAGPSTALAPLPEMPLFNTREEYEHWLTTGEPPATVEDPVVEAPKRKERISVPPDPGMAAGPSTVPEMPKFNTREEWEHWVATEERIMRDGQQHEERDEAFDAFLAYPQTQATGGQSPTLTHTSTASAEPMRTQSRASSETSGCSEPQPRPEYVDMDRTVNEAEAYQATERGKTRPATVTAEAVKRPSTASDDVSGSSRKNTSPSVRTGERVRVMPEGATFYISHKTALQGRQKTQSPNHVTSKVEPDEMGCHDEGRSDLGEDGVSGAPMGKPVKSLYFDVDLAASSPSSETADSSSADDRYYIDFDPSKIQHASVALAPSRCLMAEMDKTRDGGFDDDCGLPAQYRCQQQSAPQQPQQEHEDDTECEFALSNLAARRSRVDHSGSMVNSGNDKRSMHGGSMIEHGGDGDDTDEYMPSDSDDKQRFRARSLRRSHTSGLGLVFDVGPGASSPSSETVDAADEHTTEFGGHKGVISDCGPPPSRPPTNISGGYNIDFDPPGPTASGNEDMLDPPPPVRTGSLPRLDIPSPPIQDQGSRLRLRAKSDHQPPTSEPRGYNAQPGDSRPLTSATYLPDIPPLSNHNLDLQPGRSAVLAMLREGKIPCLEGFPSADIESSAHVSTMYEWLCDKEYESSSNSLAENQRRSPSPPPTGRDNRAVLAPKTTTSDVGSDDDVSEDVSAVQALLNRWLDNSASALLLKDDAPVT